MRLDDLNKKRLILIDLDGTTLRNDGKTIHPKTKEALIKASKNGHYVCIITARPNRASIQYYRELGLNTLLNNFDGGHIHDPGSEEFKRILFPLSNDIIKSILNEKPIKDLHENILIEYYNKSICSKKDYDVETFFHLEYGEEELEDDNYFIGDPFSWTGPSCNISLVFNNSSKDLDNVYRVFEKYHNSISLTSVGFGKNKDKTLINITSKLVDKGHTAMLLAQYYNVDIRDVIAFGDEMNDINMIKNVGYGIAMKNGNRILKTFCRGITHLDNNNGGVGDYLEKLLAGKEV